MGIFELMALFFITLLNLLIVGLVAIQGWKNRENRFFAGSAAMAALWATGVVLLTQSSSAGVMWVGGLFFLIAPVFVVQLLSLFATVFPDSKGRVLSPANFALLPLSFGLVLAIIFSPNFIIDDIVVSGGQNQLLVAPLGYAIYSAYFIIAFTVIFTEFLLKAEKSRGKQRVQILYIFWGMLAAAVISSLTNLFMPLLGDSSLIWAGPLSTIFYIGAIGVAIVKHRLFDIKLAVVRSIAYLLSILMLALVYYLLVLFISTAVLKGQSATVFGENHISVFLALALAFLFQPVRRFFDRLTDGVFYRNQYDSEAFYGRLSGVLTTESTDLHSFLLRITDEIGNTLKAERAFIHVRWGQHHAVAGVKGHSVFSDSDLEVVRQYTAEHNNEIVVTNNLPRKHPIYSLFASREVAMVVPLVQKGVMIGCLFLGNRRSGEYVKRDIRVLGTISNELIIAIQNALSMQEVREFNKTLQQRIEEATSELRASNEKLKQLDAAKDEFVSMASHQLRTPLTSVKGYISMVLEGDAGKITPAQRKLLGEAFMSSERMVHLISDFLNVSRLQTGKFVIDKSLVNLADIVGEEVTALRATARVHSIKLTYRKPSKIPMLYLDEGKLRQVIMNFIDNAIFYSQDHSVATVKLKVEDGCVVLEVTDAGIGVPVEEQKQLFTKFFRAENARRQRPDGTGIGLFLAKKVVTAHGGEMVFESTEGEGSTFGFRLPIKKLSQPPSEDAPDNA